MHTLPGARVHVDMGLFQQNMQSINTLWRCRCVCAAFGARVCVCVYPYVRDCVRSCYYNANTLLHTQWRFYLKPLYYMRARELLMPCAY